MPVPPSRGQAPVGIQPWIPAFAGMSGGCRSDLLVKQPSLAAKSCSQVLQPSLQYKQASSPVLFGEAPGRPVFPFVSPQKMRGMARQGAQPLFFVCPHSLSEIRGAARRATQTSLRSLGSFTASSLRRRAALFVAARETRNGLRQPAPGGRLLLAARRSPGAARVRALRGTPAGAASDPTRITPHESAPGGPDE